MLLYPMSGIYIHIPYCKKACYYCDFHFSTNLKNMGDMIKAICTEITLRKSECFLPINTIYFGGGTPSVLPIHFLKNIIEALNKNYDLGQVAEITIEVNPDDISNEFLAALKDAGFNRLSIGIQSFNQDHLTWMNRSHTVKQAESVLLSAAQFGFESSSIDLIYGFQNLSNDDWATNVSKAFDSGLNHLSAYALTIEEKTPFHKLQLQQKVALVNDSKAWEQFKYLHDIAERQGWDHYEISNFAKKNNRSKHNGAYWSGKPYLGFGPGAHSYDGAETRSWNAKDNWKYIDDILQKYVIPIEKETLSKQELTNEKIMVGLRTKEGISAALVENQLSIKSHPIQIHLQNGLAFVENERLKLSLEGWWISDSIIAELFET